MKIKNVVTLLSVLIVMFIFPITASAANVDIVDVPEFNDIKNGDGKYLGNEYRKNYYLDIEELGVFDMSAEAANGLANTIFNFCRIISYFTVVLFYHSIALNLADMFKSEIFAIVVSLRKVFFDGAVFLFVFAGSAFFIVKQLLKGNLQNILSEVLKVVAILAISLMIAGESVAFLGFINTVTKQVSIQALGGIAREDLMSDDQSSVDEGSLKQYAADASSILWSSLVHKPWLSLEFDEHTATQDEIEALLTLEPESEQRKKEIEKIGVFKKSMAGSRLSYSLFFAIPILIRCIFYVIIAFLFFSYQFQTLFYVLTSPIVLVSAVAPQLGGIDLITKWLKKIIETQFAVLILTIVVGITVKFDALIYTKLEGLGWLIAFAIQIILIVSLYMNRHKLLSGIVSFSNIVKSPQSMLDHVSDSTDNMAHTAQNTLYNNRGITQNALYRGRSMVRALEDKMRSGSSANYQKVSQYQPSRRQESPQAPEPAAPAAPANINDAVETVQQSEKINTGNVIDYNKIPRYQKRIPQISDTLQQQSASLSYGTVAANGDVFTDYQNNTFQSMPYEHVKMNESAPPHSMANVPVFVPKNNLEQSETTKTEKAANNKDSTSTRPISNTPAYIQKSGIAQNVATKTETTANNKDSTQTRPISNTPVFVPKSNPGKTVATKTEATANNKVSIQSRPISNTPAFVPKKQLEQTAQTLTTKTETAANNKDSTQTRPISNTPVFIPKSNPAKTVATKTEATANNKTYTQSQSITNIPVFVPQNNTAQNVATKAETAAKSKEPQAAKNKKTPETSAPPTTNRGQAPQPPANLSSRTPTDLEYKKTYSTKMDVRSFIPKKPLDKSERPPSIHAASAKNKKS